MMKIFRAIEILTVLTKTELDSLKEYLSLSSTNCRPQVNELFIVLYQHQEEFPISKIGISSLTGLSPKRLDDLVNKLLTHIEQFCALESLKKYTSEIELQRHLLSFFSERGLNDLYESVYRKKAEQTKGIKAFFPLDHLNLYNYQTALVIHEKIMAGREVTIKLADYIYHLDIFYCIEKLKLACENINRKNVANTSYEEDLALMFHFAKKYSTDHPLVYAYLHILKFLQGEKITSEEFDVLFETIRSLPATPASYPERLTLCHYLLNISLRNVKSGHTGFRRHYLEIVAFMELKGLLLERGIISSPLFKSAISVGLKENRHEWAEVFFKKYSARLPENNRTEIVNFCEGLILYSKREYDKAREKLRLIDLPEVDIYFKLNIRRLLMKMYVEEHLGKPGFSYSHFDDMARNFRLFVNSKNNIGEQSKKDVLKFIFYTRKVVANYTIPAKRKLLKAKILLDKQLPEKDWLLTMLNIEEVR